MCVRFGSCCGIKLETVALFSAYYSVLLVIALVILSGFYLHEGVGYKYVGLYEGYDEKASHNVYGSLFLAMAALWTLATISMFLAIHLSIHCLLMPYLILQVISMMLGISSVIERMYWGRDSMSFVALPFVIIGIPQFIGVFSYFMEMMEAKVNQRVNDGPITFYN